MVIRVTGAFMGLVPLPALGYSPQSIYPLDVAICSINWSRILVSTIGLTTARKCKNTTLLSTDLFLPLISFYRIFVRLDFILLD